MVSILLTSRDLLFLHVPRTAGGSLSRALRQEPDATVYGVENMEYAEPCVEQLQRRLPNRLSDYTTFAVVRNPWDWAVSGYIHLTANAPAFDDPPTFADFVRGAGQRATRNPYPAKFTSGTTCVTYHAGISQWEHITTNGILTIDHLCRFESLEDDLLKVLGKKVDLPHVHKSERTHYASYYDEATMLIVARRNAPLIKHFGYRF